MVYKLRVVLFLELNKCALTETGQKNSTSPLGCCCESIQRHEFTGWPLKEELLLLLTHYGPNFFCTIIVEDVLPWWWWWVFRNRIIDQCSKAGASSQRCENGEIKSKSPWLFQRSRLCPGPHWFLRSGGVPPWLKFVLKEEHSDELIPIDYNVIPSRRRENL